MERTQADRILAQFPSLNHRVVPLLAYGREPGWSGETDISDPTGGEVNDYLAFFDLADAQAQRLRRLFSRERHFPLPK